MIYQSISRSKKALSKQYQASGWVVFLATFAFMLSACNSNQQNQNRESKNNTNHETKSADNDDGQLQLNNGVKWKADAATNTNVGALQKIVAQNQPTDLNEYQQRGKQLRERIDKMIKECGMSGAEHEALHHWLEPLIEEVHKLQQANSKDQAVEAYEKIKNQIESYENMFE